MWQPRWAQSQWLSEYENTMPSKIVGFEEEEVTEGWKVLHTENNSHLSVWHIYGQYLFQYWMEVSSIPQDTKKIVINLIFI